MTAWLMEGKLSSSTAALHVKWVFLWSPSKCKHLIQIPERATKIYEMMKTVYGNKHLQYISVLMMTWERCEDLKNDPRNGQLSTAQGAKFCWLWPKQLIYSMLIRRWLTRFFIKIWGSRRSVRSLFQAVSQMSSFCQDSEVLPGK